SSGNSYEIPDDWVRLTSDNRKISNNEQSKVDSYYDSIIRLKRCLEEIRDDHSTSISNNSVISILRSRAFFEDVGYLANTLLPIKLAILEVEGRSTNLADCYISLLRIAASCWFYLEIFRKKL
ncbi:13153_t:CDS:2, partial [Entrophospora sp. SA101]